MKKDTKTTPKQAAKTSAPAAPALMALLTDGLHDLYWAENHLVKALPKMIRAASAAPLVKALENHLEETRGQVARLEDAFAQLDEKAIAKKCDAMEGLSKEGEAIVESTPEGSATRDAGIILASQKIEHYEIASYTGLSKLAEVLGLDAVAALLQESLAEEQEADATLAGLAEKEIFEAALNEA